ncbi:MAG: hypothetical protein IIY71_02010 [Oscillospiraceae bacterium]|nr:hypothetical protein [Oscillospiraceae bacterium]
MQILLDGCLAFFAAVGIGAILFSLAHTGPLSASEQDAPLLVFFSVQGDGKSLHILFSQLQKQIHPANIILVDDGLDEQGQKIVSELLRKYPALRCCPRNKLIPFIAPAQSEPCIK